MQEGFFCNQRGTWLKFYLNSWWVTLSWEIFIPLPWDTLRHQRWVRTIFLFALALKCHGNCHKYLCQTNICALRYSLLQCRSQPPQKQMTLCHVGAIRIYTPVPRTSNKHNSNRSQAWKKASFVLRHPCPPLTYLWKPQSHSSFQTAFIPAPTSLLHTPTCLCTHPYQPLCI